MLSSSTTVLMSFLAFLLVMKKITAFGIIMPSLGVATTTTRPYSNMPSRLFSASMGDAERKVLARDFRRHRRSQQQQQPTTIVDENNNKNNNVLWTEQLQSLEVQQVRMEMVNKYISLGKSAELAEQEVDDFLLHNPDMAQPFVEMRYYAKRNKKFDDMGLEIVLQTFVVFVVCLLTTIGIQYLYCLHCNVS